MVAEQARTEFPHLDINQDIEWLSAICADGGTSVLVLSAWQGDRLLGLAPFQVHPSQLQFAFGELTLARKQVRRFALERHPLLSDSLPAEALIECFAALADRLPEDGAVFLRGVPESSTMHALLTERGGPLKALFHVVPHGPSCSVWVCRKTRASARNSRARQAPAPFWVTSSSSTMSRPRFTAAISTAAASTWSTAATIPSGRGDRRSSSRPQLGRQHPLL